MFEISGTDISLLGDADLRTLVARLAIAELRARGLPVASVTAGGNQDAADGGIDVRVECPADLLEPDFVPRCFTGFQVKKPDMKPAAILTEMRPKGALRPSIAEIARNGGAYIIVSAQGSVADRPLAERRRAMRGAVGDCPGAEEVHVDFYDRERLATWANENPGIAAWIRGRLGQPLGGWASIGRWSGTGVAEPSAYLFNDKACLVDERSSERPELTIAEGIEQLRAAVSKPGAAIRLIGLSGFGKTRLVQALFEDGVGETPLDPGLSVYTDYSEETQPTARDMARQLMMAGRRAILIIDNCNPATHEDLARICTEDGSRISLLTVEYDVREDEPERTDVFRLQAASPDIVEKWLEATFPTIRQLDRRKIAEFSDGNFRVARAIADTLRKGETLGKLKSRDLFERIFQQRQGPDPELMKAAEEIALLYSVDGEDVSEESELARIAALRGTTPAALFAALAVLRKRDIVQARGRWRAILPHAIANPLATLALDRIAPADLDRFAASLTPRMLRSLSRRLGYLHDSAVAQASVARWIASGGPLGELIEQGEDGFQIIANLAPVVPEAVLVRIEEALSGPARTAILSPKSIARGRWIRLIKLLAYEPAMFERAAIALSRFLVVEGDGHNSQSAREMFTELFHLHLSGTKALPAQRRALVRRMAASTDPIERECAAIALGGLLQANHFMSSSDFDFGARPRDFGWHPPIYGDIFAWHSDAIDLAAELSASLPEAGEMVATNIRDLWRYRACHDALERAAATFSASGSWIKGWIAFRSALRFDGDIMPDDVRTRLEALIEQLRPKHLLGQARAVVLAGPGSGWDVADGEPDEGDAMRPWHRASAWAVEVGRSMAQEPDLLRTFLPELVAEQQPQRGAEFGRGLAEGAQDIRETWSEIRTAFAATAAERPSIEMPGGYLFGAHARDPATASQLLDEVAADPAMVRFLPALQGRVSLDKDGLARLSRAIASDALVAADFRWIANGSVIDSPAIPLAHVLRHISILESGTEVALEILSMRFLDALRTGGEDVDPALVKLGRSLLRRADLSRKEALRDFGLAGIVRGCCAGPEGEAAARELCVKIHELSKTMYLSNRDFSYLFKALFEAQPLIALDQFLVPSNADRIQSLFDADFGMGTPVEELAPEILSAWAGANPEVRYPLLGQAIAMFKRRQGEEENILSPLFLKMLAQSPDGRAFIGSLGMRIQPRSWGGSLADVLVLRRAALLVLGDEVSAEVRSQIEDFMPELDRWIERERGRDRQTEESFE